MSIIEHIFEYPFLMNIFDKLLTDKEKLKLICNKFIYNNRLKLRFHTPTICKGRSYKNWYYNCLTHVITKDIFKFPDHVTHLKLIQHKHKIHLSSIKEGDIPKTVTHLHCSEYFNKKIVIPNNVSHIYFEENESVEFINSSITVTNLEILDLERDECGELGIPKCVENLTFSYRVKYLGNVIKNSIKKITFKGKFYQSLIEEIPLTVTHLMVNNPTNFKFPDYLKVTKCDPKESEISIAGFEY